MPKKPADEAVFHEPFTLKIHIDKEHFYEEKFGKIPFVHNGDVYLFKGDEFGLTLNIRDNFIRAVKYEPDMKKVDVTLKFTQEVEADGTAIMMLHIHNNTKHTLYVDALMTAPGKKGIAKTTILPVQPGLSGFESWSQLHRAACSTQHPNSEMTATANNVVEPTRLCEKRDC